MKSPHGGGLGYQRTAHLHDTRSRVSAHILKESVSPKEFFAFELPDMPPPKGGGWRDGGLCPFHGDKRGRSFRVNVDTGAFRCFSCGAKGGDVLAFKMLRDGIGFPVALRELAEVWGVSDG